jgi:hypothetical protein
MVTNFPSTDRARRGRRDDAYGAFVYGGPGGIEPIGPEPELKRRFLGFNRLGSFIDERGIGGAQIFRNRLRLREGPGAIDAEHLGGLAAGIHTTMLSCEPDTPGGRPVLKIFNDWPKDWDADFTLRARGAFVVSSAQRDGKIPFVEIQALAGGEFELVNPWHNTEVTVYREGKPTQESSGDTLALTTKVGETIVVAPKGSRVSGVNVP